MSNEMDKAVGNTAAVASIAATTIAAAVGAPVVAAVAASVGVAITGAALYHKITTEQHETPSPVPKEK